NGVGMASPRTKTSTSRTDRARGPARTKVLSGGGRTHHDKEGLMEAKVDVRKLQILNDRINQTIDALNQVRLSVHGLAHTGFTGQPPNPYWGQQQSLGYPQTQGIFPGMQLGGFGQMSGPFSQVGQQGFGQTQQGFPGFGLQHSPYTNIGSPFTNVGNPYVNPVSSPWGGTGGIGGYATNPYVGGLFHSNNPELIEQRILEERANDPTRITNTFPFATM